MQIAVVILNWNGRDLLKKFLPSVLNFSDSAEVYVADNNSDDDSVAFVQENFPKVKIIQMPENKGFAGGYNEALKQIWADVYCLLNSDVEVTENWLSPIQKIFSENENIAVVQPKIRSLIQKDFFEYAGAAGGFLDKFGFPFCRGRIFNSVEKDCGQYNEPTPIFWASGACFFIRSEVFHQLGFDEDFFAHQEEIDLCWRVHQTGKEIFYCPDSVVFHLGGATLPVENPLKIYLNFRNGLFLLLKNLPKNQLFPIIFSRLILDGFAGIHFLLKGKIRFTIAIIKAHFSFYKNFKKFYKKRKNQSFKDYYQIKSVAFEYFLRKKKTFSDLFK